MRGRKPVQGFNYVTLEGSAKEVQQQGSEIDFMESDITVLSQDILTVPEEEILNTEIVYTIVGGKILYKK